ncbi:hypothetical protein J2741_001457 [Methanolinea mesophila]|uniref:hypothetical protein n=1 Tax=Methanolinea mesophila TaxID=547055 RepID=UPI001AE9FBD8|nr:hypothetical protein [Methanolinea mesophila]MBP1928910.1 hypothetical protein [Methanolinea mesophila]
MIGLFLVNAASAVTFVINDGSSSLSLSATADHDVALSNVIAQNPESYSATMSAGDNGGATASQESTVEGADFVFAASGAVSHDGDSSYTYTETYGGSSSSSQQAYAGQGTTSVAQQTTSDALAGASVSGARDAQGTTATESNAYTVGVNNVSLTANTNTSAAASQSGFFAGLFANTLGIATAFTGANSTTGSTVGAGFMTYNATATANATTNASQDVAMVAGFGSAFAASHDQAGNSAVQSAGFIGGILNAVQSANTDHSATASQSGMAAGIAGNSFGAAHSQEGDRSGTGAGMFAGLMTFEGTTTASQQTTAASQDTGMDAIAGFARTFAMDHGGNMTSQSARIAVGTMNLTQQADTSGSAQATQSGTMTAAMGGTSGHAGSGGETSSTDTRIVLGSMDFEGSATANGNTDAGQSLDMAALFGSAQARSDDGTGNVTGEGSGIILGSMNISQETDTSGSAHATQNGDMTAAYGFTGTHAGSGTEQSSTDAEILIGTMSFGSSANASGHTDAGQSLDMAALYGNASAGSNDGTGNATVQGSGIILGTMNTVQETNTSGSAHAAQSGDMSAALGSTWGEADSGTKESRSEAHILVGTMSFDGSTAANGDTRAAQSLDLAALYGSVSAGSNDGTGNATWDGSGIVIGTLNTVQETDTSGSAHATQTGEVNAGYGFTWNDATSGTGQSWTHGDVLVGTMSFGNNATANGHTNASQTVSVGGNILPVAGMADTTAGSNDGRGNVTEVGSGIILGTMDITQGSDTSGSANAVQNGEMSAGYGSTWGSATSGGEQSSTETDILLGTMTYAGNATANGHTDAGQSLDMAALYGNISAASDDGRGNTTVQGSRVILGTLNATQQANTSGSAHAVQNGDLAALYGTTWGEAAHGSDLSKTEAELLVGTMSFGNAATSDGHTEAGQSLDMAALSGSAAAGSEDGTGNITIQRSEFILGIMNSTQQADTAGSTHATQSGDLAALHGATRSGAMSGDQLSVTEGEVFVGAMSFGSNATANGHTAAGQALDMAALYGDTSAVSEDGAGNVTEEGSQFILGMMNITQQADTGGSAHAAQGGDVAALYGTTWGNATSGDEQSWTDADVIIGGMSFDNNAVADGHTEAAQTLNSIGIYGNASAGSHEGANDTEVGTGFILGYLDISQQANTSASAHANQSGTLIAGLGNTWGNATSGDAQSWTRSDVFVGMITIGDNSVTAGAGTAASQGLSIAALNGSASTGSSDGNSNTTEVGAAVSGGNFTALLETDWSSQDLSDLPGLVTDVVGDIGGGYIEVDQNADTSGSSHAAQSGTVVALGNGQTWANATSGAGDQSWTASNVTTGIIVLDGNHADAGTGTAAGQSVFIAGMQGRAVTGSSDSTGNSTVGTQFDGSGDATGLNIDGLVNFVENPSPSNFTAWTSGVGDVGAGYLSMDQQTGSGAGTNAYQSSTPGLGILPGGVTVFNANGSTWSEASSGSNRSWTNADVTSTSVLLPGVLTVTSDSVSAGPDGTYASHDVEIGGQSGNAAVGSSDGTNAVEMGAEFTDGILSMYQLTGAGSGAYARQGGDVDALYGTTWGNASSGNNQSWTSSHVDTGSITVTDNQVYADGSTSASQSIYNVGINGDASVGSTDGTNIVEIGAGYSNGGSLSNSISGLTGQMTQKTSTGGSAGANQTGVVGSVAGTGYIRGNATSGNNQSWTTSHVDTGSITVTDNQVYADGSTSASQSIYNVGFNGDASVGSTDGTNIVEIGAGYSNGGSLSNSILGLTGQMTQKTSTGGSAVANQTGYVVVTGTGYTYGDASSDDNRSWTSSNVAVGSIAVKGNEVDAGSDGTRASQDVEINGASGNAAVGSSAGTTTAETGALFTAGSLDMMQVTSGDLGAHARQSGSVTGTLTGSAKTWGLAISGANQSWTTTEAKSTMIIPAILTITSNSMNAGTEGTNASQNVGVSAVSGSASVNSTDGTNRVEVGANFDATGSFVNLNQVTNSTAGVYANQSGTVSGGSGGIWGNARAGDGDTSYTKAAFTLGTLTLNNNGVYAGNSRTSASQDLSISGGIGSSSSAESGSINSVNGNYAKVSASYPTSLRSATSSLIVTQSTDNDAAVIGRATAQQNTRITAYNNLALNAMTHTEAGNASGSKAYVDTVAKSGYKILNGGVQSVTINSNSNAVGGLDNLTASEQKQASGTSGSWQTTASAKDAAGTISTPSTAANTNALAWVNLISKGRVITTF